MELFDRLNKEGVEFETIYYQEEDNGKRRFAIIKFRARTTQKSIISGAFQFAIVDERELEELNRRIRAKIGELRNEDPDKIAGAVFDIVAENVIGGITFEISVEEALYIAKLIEKHVEEDHDEMRLLRAFLIHKNSKKDISVV